MKQIPLTRGKVALVDDEDYERVNKLTWWAYPKRGRTWYAVTKIRNAAGKKVMVGMHRFILNPADNMEVDHKDGDGLNNVRLNLRPATRLQNSFNMGVSRRSTSGYRGVYQWGGGLWQVRLRGGAIDIFLGRFADATEAAKVWDAAARIHYGEFARLNFPDDASKSD